MRAQNQRALNRSRWTVRHGTRARFYCSPFKVRYNAMKALGYSFYESLSHFDLKSCGQAGKTSRYPLIVHSTRPTVAEKGTGSGNKRARTVILY